MKKSESNELSPRVVLGVAAHPDDLDFGAAGSMAKWASEGAEVYYLILTDGSKGTDDTSIAGSKLTEIRTNEQAEAAEAIGAKGVQFLDYVDGELGVKTKLKRDIVRAIRTHRPDVVITMDPTFVYSSKYGFINHPDHRAAGQATLDAVYPFARDKTSFPELLAEGLEPYNVGTLLLINFDNANFVVDISRTIDNKLRALAAHKSQIDSDGETLSDIRSRSVIVGSRSGFEYAESFVRIDIQ